uniref:Uncharacterized protein n=1 Tax=Acrobeloides nanus TaxID=290746 RepID=A0A914DQN1_9BILA
MTKMRLEQTEIKFPDWSETVKESIDDDGGISNKPSRQTQECNNCHTPACPEHYVELKLCHTLYTKKIGLREFFATFP